MHISNISVFDMLLVFRCNYSPSSKQIYRYRITSFAPLFTWLLSASLIPMHSCNTQGLSILLFKQKMRQGTCQIL